MLTWFQKMSLLKRVLALVVVLNIIMTLIVVNILQSESKKTAISMAIDSAVDIIHQYKIVRGYYTKNVVAKVKANGGLNVTFAHKNIPNTIPLPATFIHELSQEYRNAGNNIQLNLYSAFPFPNRKDRVLDAFQEEAIRALNSNPKQIYSKTYFDADKGHVRVAIADTMTQNACVKCHNTHPDTPKNDWKLGDVRGVLEVDTNITKSLTYSKKMSNSIILIVLLNSILIVILLFSIFSKYIINPMKNLLKVLKYNSGQTRSQCGDISKSTDEIERNLSSQSSAVQETTSSLEEISAMLSTSLSEMKKSSNQSIASSDEAREGVEIAKRAVATIQEISSNNDRMEKTLHHNNQNLEEIVDVINRIADKAKVINEIVFQTKLLSFNASVEAARSGEHGKGFSVVAEEVGNLAQMSGSAAEEISEIIGEGVSKIREIIEKTKLIAEELIKTGAVKVESGTAIIRKCEEALLNISHHSDDTKISMESIQNAYGEQATGVKNISQSMTEISATVSEILLSAKEASNKSKEMLDNTDRIDETVEKISSLILGEK